LSKCLNSLLWWNHVYIWTRKFSAQKTTLRPVRSHLGPRMKRDCKDWKNKVSSYTCTETKVPMITSIQYHIIWKYVGLWLTVSDSGQSVELVFINIIESVNNSPIYPCDFCNYKVYIAYDETIYRFSNRRGLPYRFSI